MLGLEQKLKLVWFASLVNTAHFMFAVLFLAVNFLVFQALENSLKNKEDNFIVARRKLRKIVRSSLTSPCMMIQPATR